MTLFNLSDRSLERELTDNHDPEIDQKALKVNLDNKIYGTFAEIGAGQEVARHFFRVGGAAGTIAKSLSAYDMTFSDRIYGKTDRYVSRERLEAMLAHEYALLIERLAESRGSSSTFFAFANTVAARNFQGTNECHGWMGIRFQMTPEGEPHDIIMHVRMMDNRNVLQQEALGIIGVNFIYGVFFNRENPDRFVKSLLDGLSNERIEVDMLEFSGPSFNGVDNRAISLRLLENGLTSAVLFGAKKNVLQPSEILRKRPILVCRGSFKPMLTTSLDMMRCALTQFKKDPRNAGKEPFELFEISRRSLTMQPPVDDKDLFDRVDAIAAVGYPVLITDYPEFYRLIEYLRRYTSELIGSALTVSSLLRVFDEKYYQKLEGGLLEALGRFLKRDVKLYVYPVKRSEYESLIKQEKLGELPVIDSLPSILHVNNAHVRDNLSHLYAHLISSGAIESMQGYDENLLSIDPRVVLLDIEKGKSDWEKFVPNQVASLIKERGAFGFQRSFDKQTG